MSEQNNMHVSDTQLLLAKLYRYVTLIGFAVIAVGFIVYVSGVLPSSIPVGEMSSYWHLSAEEFSAKTGIPHGWKILRNLGHGDSLSLATLVLIPISIIVCLLVMAGAFFKRKDWIFCIVVSLESVVLTLAASGIIAGH